MKTISTITVLGAGYVGLTTAALLAHSGYKVYAVEPNKQRLSVIREGRSFFFEEGLDPIIKGALDDGSLIATDSYEESVANSQVVFSCVGTPDNPDGSSNLTYVFEAAKTSASLMQPGTLYVQKSTVPVGTGSRIEELFTSLNVDAPYVSNPEFLREGTALYDTLYFDRVVAGGNNQEAVKDVLDIYRHLEQSRDRIAAIADIQPASRKDLYIPTSLNSAELIKVTSNAFLALKISFANSIAKLSDKAGADITEVMDAVGADERIGRAFLNAGRGYGGGCFPKDVSGLIASGLEYGVNLDIMSAAQEVNQSMPNYIIEKLQDKLGVLADKKVAVLGLAFKAGTSDVRKSPGIALALGLVAAGSKVSAYDPEALEEAATVLPATVALHPSIEEAIENADAVILATNWADIINFPADRYKELLGGNTLVDGVNSYPKQATQDAGLVYIGIGR